MAFNPFLPAYISPLTDKQHAQLGRIALLWGQADYILDMLLQDAVGLTREQHKLLLEEKPFGAKLAMLKQHLHAMKNEEARDCAKVFHGILDLTKSKRNQAFHGTWGWRAGSKEGQPEICARHFKVPHDPVKVGDLPKLEKDLCSATAAGNRGLLISKGFDVPQGVIRFLHGSQDEAPEWFWQWTEQHPLRDDNLDQNWKEGELPRLIDPLK